MKKIIVANWKLNHSIIETSSFLNNFLNSFSTEPANIEIVIAPPFTSLACASQILANSHISLAAQNCFYESRGSFTGEISPQFLKELHCSYVIVGHSERRELFAETNEIVTKKALAVSNTKMTPILCIGETLEQRQKNNWKQVLEKQLSSIQNKEIQKIIIAYEPIWAIGTGKAATVNDIKEAHAFIHQILLNHLSAEKSALTPILYGGSVNPQNTFDIIKQPHVDGLLIGSASLKEDSLIKILDVVNNIYSF